MVDERGSMALGSTSQSKAPSSLYNLDLMYNTATPKYHLPFVNKIKRLLYLYFVVIAILQSNRASHIQSVQSR